LSQVPETISVDIAAYNSKLMGILGREVENVLHVAEMIGNV
jgi:hypothetical protein